MFYVPLYVEWLRSRPALVFWLATLAQAVVWLAGADAVLRGAARRSGAASRHRPRIPLRQRCRTAARLLARRNRVSHRRPVRRLCAGADLRGRDLLVRLRARPRHRRTGACGAGGAADGRHFAVHGAVAGFRPADFDHGVVGGGAAALLASGSAGAASARGTCLASRRRSFFSPPTPR